MFNADTGNSGYRWQLIRMRPHSESEVTLLSSSFFSLTTHFSRITVACAVEECALCELLPSRGLFYLACMCQGRRHILELGVFSANDLEQHAKLLHGGLRPGLRFRLWRDTKKGAVHSEVLGETAGCGEVDQLTLAQRVLAVYKLPCCNPGESIDIYERRIHGIVQRRNVFLATQLTSSKSVGG
jgi:hypothetical protein